jgi:hypothetical protein
MNAMSHLSAERLAALADDEPTTTEGEHLARCAACARERGAHRALLALATRDSGSTALPLTRWESLLPALRAEAIAKPAAPVGGSWRHPAGNGWMRAAAAVLLIAGGMIAGRYSAGADPVPGLVTRSTLDTTTRLAAAVIDTLPTFESTAQAVAALAQYGRAYEAAANFLAAHDTSLGLQPRETYEARLATLDQVAAATRQGLQATPYDPVVNRYYLATLGAREATLRQLNTSLPDNMQVGGY